MPRPCGRLQRAASAPTYACLYGLLQLCENPSISEQGCADAAGYSGRWAHLCEPNSRRITSSVRSELIYDRDSPITTHFSDNKSKIRSLPCSYGLPRIMLMI